MGERSTLRKTALCIATGLLFGSGLFHQCANIAAPQGGPRDTLPPRVMAAEPAFNTINFDDKKILITFDEYIQLKDQQKEFFTSPPMKSKPTLLIKGKSLQIDIKDTLKENTTYVLNFGSALRDNNEGNALNGFRFAFSTGPELDSMLMSGYTVDAYKADSVSRTMIFFFDPVLDSIPERDSTLFRTPNALARAENNGIFIARNLKPMDYRVYAVQDANNNFTYDPGVDKVGFLSGTFNPTKLPDFDAWFDTTRNYTTADPQLFFRLFMDSQFRRQNLADKKRTSQHKIELFFNAPYPQIDSLTLEGIEPDRIIKEYLTKGRDTIALWLNVPGDQLPDTIKGRIVYHRHDSINELQPYADKLSLFWKHIESKEEQKEREKLEKALEKALEAGEEFEMPEVPNPFRMKHNISGEMNPEKDIILDFDYPLVALDTTGVSVIRFEDDKMYRVRHTIERDTMNLRRYTISAPWAEEQKYRLEILPETFRNVAGEMNDTIRQEFTTMSAEKFGTLSVNVKGKSDSSLYVLRLLDEKGTLLQEKLFVSTGLHVFRFLPAGDVKLHVLEDSNGNGRWDTGDLIRRIQPERMEIYFSESGSELMTMKVNWDIEITVDMNELFKPFDIMDIRRQLEQSENQRTKRMLEERAKKAAAGQGNQQNQQQGMGFGNPMGNINF